MKKLYLLFFIVVLISAPVFAQQVMSPTAEQLAAWQNFKTSSGRAWQIMWDNTGLPASIYGTRTVPQIGEPRAIAESFLNQLKDVFGFNNLQQDLIFSGIRQDQVDTIILQHVDFQPHVNGIPVFGSKISVHINKKGQIYLVGGHANQFSAPTDRTQPLLSSELAISLAMLNVEQPVNLRGDVKTRLGYVFKDDSYILVWRVTLPTKSPTHNWLVDISQDGILISKRDLILHYTGLANVYLYHPFDPRESSTREVILYDLDTIGILKGRYADVFNATLPRLTLPNNDFRMPPNNIRFDEANAYHQLISSRKGW